MSIILRLNKGSELTWNEVDTNWQSLYYSSSLAGSTLNFYFTGSGASHSIDLSTLPGLGGVQVYYEGNQINYAKSFYFTGSGVNVTSLLGGGVLVNIPESAGGDNQAVQFASGSGDDALLSGSQTFTFDYVKIY